MLSAGRVRAQNEAEIGLPAYRYCEDRELQLFGFLCRDRASVRPTGTPDSSRTVSLKATTGEGVRTSVRVAAP